MSHLSDLIEELCPEGVPYVELCEVAEVVRGDRITKKQLVEDGEYVAWSGGREPFGRFNDYNREADTITVAQYGSAGYVNWVDEKFWANDVCYSVFPKEGMDNRFLCHMLLQNQKLLYDLTTKAIPDCLPKERLEGIQIPLPPLPVQREIVRILDLFTELTAELTAELELRKKQYAYYRDKLLAFEGEDVEWVTQFEKIGDFLEHEQPTKYLVKDTNYSDEYEIPVLTAGQTFILGYTNETNGIYPASKDNPVIIFDDFTTAFQWVDFPFKAKSSAMKILKAREGSACLIRYLFYLMQTIKFTPEGHKRHWIGTYSQLEIPLPPLEEQQRIVTILDKFDALVNDLKFGIPAEIEGRKKQYEYYREKLLSFKSVD